MSLDRYPPKTVKLEKGRGPDRLAAQIRATLGRQDGVGTFRLYGRSGRRLASRLKDALDTEFDVMLFVPDPDQASASHRDWYRRYVTELYLRPHAK